MRWFVRVEGNATLVCFLSETNHTRKNFPNHAGGIALAMFLSIFLSFAVAPKTWGGKRHDINLT